MAYLTGEDALGPDLAATLGTLVGGYLFSTLGKAKPGNPWTVAGEAGTLAAAAVTRRLTNRPYLSAIAEGLQYGTAFGLGEWIGEATTTLGHHGPGAVQPWLPGGSTSTASASLAQPKAEVARADIVQPLPTTGPTTLYRFQRRRTAY
jgi:hypothetical protein